MKINSLPTNYKAPSSIYIGSNIISNVNTLIDFKGFAPILIAGRDRTLLMKFEQADRL